MSKEQLQEIIENFDTDKLTNFFRNKNNIFVPKKESLMQYNDSDFENSLQLGEMNFGYAEHLIVCAFKSIEPLTERSGKKKQYEKGREILKNLSADAGIFIFYSQNGNFRFSLIYTNYLGKKRDWNNYRRLTYLVSKNFTNKTFLRRIGEEDFSSLENIKCAFSTEKINNDFYQEIANWYFWAAQESQFPKDAEAEENGRNISVIRLITRLIFIWFMRERELIPTALFEEQNIKKMLKNLSPEESSYYKAILQNLFFATLSTKQNERKYASESRFNRGWNQDYGNQYVFRYQELFKTSNAIKNILMISPS